MVKQWRDGGQIGITGKTRVKIRVLNWTNVVAASEYKFIEWQKNCGIDCSSVECWMNDLFVRLTLNSWARFDCGSNTLETPTKDYKRDFPFRVNSWFVFVLFLIKIWICFVHSTFFVLENKYLLFGHFEPSSKKWDLL